MRGWLLSLSALALIACGGPRVASKPPLPKGRGVYTLRYNPPACLQHLPEAHFEVQISAGWERVYLEEEGEVGEAFKALRVTAHRKPRGLFSVQGDLRERAIGLSGGHHGRALIIEALVDDAPRP